ncbi:Cytochrome c-552 [Pandoraea iniqua]|uniref:c-type cytochrome n=1 Tax=Pandoraea iniqua TaxID=2508288 RepID=UPI00125B2FD7|nr:c-type cytochrome [Pandoraea iniqua]VVE17109.1 Cytochrome c-552 [Pandoraea iniqua]
MKFRAVFSVALTLSASGMFGVLTNTATAAPSASEQTCRACHDMNDKKVGPAFRAIAASYRDDPAALAKIKKSIVEGSSGKWGSIPMPPNALAEGEADRFAAWVMSLNK